MKLLFRMFIKNADDTTDPAVRNDYGKFTGIFGICSNAVLFLVKIIIGTITSSISVTADAMNNLCDAGSSVITMFGFKIAGKPADAKHPYGHARMEYISGLIVSGLILLMGFELMKTAVTGLIEPSLPDFGTITVVVLAAAIIVKLYVFFYNRKYGKAIDSAAMQATAADSLGDAFATAAVLISAIVSRFTGFIYLDAICGIAVSGFIFVAGFRSARETVSPLLGQPPSAEFVKKVEEIAYSEPLVIGLHDMIVHDYGPGRVMVSLHCEVSSEVSVITLHEAIDGVEARIMSELNCMATIHMDPVDLKDEVLSSLHEVLPGAVKKVDERASYHDLRVVRASGHINVIFDVLLPAGAIVDENSAQIMLCDEVRKTLPECECIINFDTDFLSR